MILYIKIKATFFWNILIIWIVTIFMSAGKIISTKVKSIHPKEENAKLFKNNGEACCSTIIKSNESIIFQKNLKENSIIQNPELEINNYYDKILYEKHSFALASRLFQQENTKVKVLDEEIGGDFLSIIAGPCSVENEEQILEIARLVKRSGASFLRGGAFKPRSSPYSFQGLKDEGLELLKLAKQETGLPIVTEIMSIEMIEKFALDVDIIQVGARNMQNFELLKELGSTRKPVLLKRGFSATIEELLMSAEYIMYGGNENVILCERGIRTFETFTRNTLDISAIPAIKKLSHLPVIVDPSHAAGIWWMVEPLALAAIAAGADGIMIEVHNDPHKAKCDGQQSITPKKFENIMGNISKIAEIRGRKINLADNWDVK